MEKRGDVSRALVVFGSTGDLMKRYLAPALVELRARSMFPEDLAIVGCARESYSDEDIRKIIAESLAESDQSAEREAIDFVLSRLHYAQVDLKDKASVASVLNQVKGPQVLYFALPPKVAHQAVATIAKCEGNDGLRLVLEKPFGEDLESARQLNELLRTNFDEDNVFRIDHFLGLRTVRNILAVRFANRALEHLFSHEHVKRVEIVWDETLALEGRASYFDGTGALKDMLQNHLLQVLSFVAMEKPDRLNAKCLQHNKLELFRSIVKWTDDEAAQRCVRGRYGEGEIDGKSVPAYRDEEGVDPKRATETFAQIELRIDNPRWKNVPFFLRSGKALKNNRQVVSLVLKPASGADLFECTSSNELQIQLNPDGLALHLNTIADDVKRPMCESQLQGDLPAHPLSPYARVLDGVLRGVNVTAVGGEEAEESWRVVEPFLRAWKAGEVPLHEYPAGSEGPQEALDRLERA